MSDGGVAVYFEEITSDDEGPETHHDGEEVEQVQPFELPVHTLTADMVADYIVDQTLQAGTNYFVGQLAFGNLTREEMLSSIGLFGQEVMPRVEKQLSRAGQARAVAA